MSNPDLTLSMAERLKKARVERGLSQKELGAMLKLSDKAVSSYEVGRANPPLETLKEISKITYKPLAYFVEEINPEDMELQVRFKRIEIELLEIKKLLQKHTMIDKTDDRSNSRHSRTVYTESKLDDMVTDPENRSSR